MAVYNDFEAFRTAALGWGLDFVQLDRGSLVATLDLTQSSNLVVTRAAFDRVFQQQGLAPPLGRTFGVLTGPGSEVRWRSHRVAPDTLLVFPVDRAFDGYSSAGFDVQLVSISDRTLDTVAEVYGLQATLEGLPASGRAVACSANSMSLLRNAISKLVGRGRRREVITRAEEYDVARLALQTYSESRDDRHREYDRRRARIYRAAIEYILANLHEDLTIPEICIELGTSERTLRYAFEEYVGVSPKAYLVAARLDRIRSDLMNAKADEAKVRDLARKHGIRSLGQFAIDYRLKFGERPSQTLRR